MQVAEDTGKSQDQISLKQKVFSALICELALIKVPVLVNIIIPWGFSHEPGTELRYLYT